MRQCLTGNEAVSCSPPLALLKAQCKHNLALLKAQCKHNLALLKAQCKHTTKKVGAGRSGELDLPLPKPQS